MTTQSAQDEILTHLSFGISLYLHLQYYFKLDTNCDPSIYITINYVYVIL